MHRDITVSTMYEIGVALRIQCCIFKRAASISAARSGVNLEICGSIAGAEPQDTKDSY
jgi:hypothetical protein